MPKYWILGFRRFVTREKKEVWEQFCDSVDRKESPERNVIFSDAQRGDKVWREYFPIEILTPASSRLLTAMDGLSDVLGSAQEAPIQEMLQEIVMDAYEAGRNGIIPPTDT